MLPFRICLCWPARLQRIPGRDNQLLIHSSCLRDGRRLTKARRSTVVRRDEEPPVTGNISFCACGCMSGRVSPSTASGLRISPCLMPRERQLTLPVAVAFATSVLRTPDGVLSLFLSFGSCLSYRVVPHLWRGAFGTIQLGSAKRDDGHGSRCSVFLVPGHLEVCTPYFVICGKRKHMARIL